MEEKLKELLSNEEYIKELVALREPAKIRESLLEHEVDVSEKEIKTVISLLKKKANGELTDEELNDVAGGSLIIVGFLICIGAVGTTAGIAAATGEYSWSWC